MADYIFKIMQKKLTLRANDTGGFGIMTLIRSTLSDLKNGLPPRMLADRMHPRGIVFVHIPKCAGSSVERALRRHYFLSRVTIDPERSFEAARAALALEPDDMTRHSILVQASEQRRELLHYHLATGYKCITGHAPLGPHTIDRFRETHDFVTILRDPVERYLSHLAYNLDGGGGHGRIDEPVEAFLERPRAKIFGSLFVKYFSGQPMDADLSTAEAITATKTRLEKMAVAGFLDRLDLFQKELSLLTGKNITIGHENRTTPSVRQDRFSDDVIKKVEALCAPDREVYDWARKTFGADR